MVYSRPVGRIHFVGIVPAAANGADLLVGQLLRHVHQPLVDAEEMLALLGPARHAVFLVLPIDQLAHPPGHQPLVVHGQQRIPIAAPDHLDHIPAGAGENGLQLLDDFAIAAHRSVEPLQVAIDHEDQVVELFAPRQRNTPQRLRLVHLAVADESPNPGVGRLLEPAILQIAVVARLVNRQQRPQAHRCCGKLPEVGHQAGVRIRGQPAAGTQLVTEVVEILLAQTAF